MNTQQHNKRNELYNITIDYNFNKIYFHRQSNKTIVCQNL